MNCSKCGAKLATDAIFCTSCGAKVETPKNVCSKCGALLRDDAIFCEQCGTRRNTEENKVSSVVEPCVVVKQEIKSIPVPKSNAKTNAVPNIKPKMVSNEDNGKVALKKIGNYLLILVFLVVISVEGVMIYKKYVKTPEKQTEYAVTYNSSPNSDETVSDEENHTNDELCAMAICHYGVKNNVSAKNLKAYTEDPENSEEVSITVYYNIDGGNGAGHEDVVGRYTVNRKTCKGIDEVGPEPVEIDISQ